MLEPAQAHMACWGIVALVLLFGLGGRSERREPVYKVQVTDNPPPDAKDCPPPPPKNRMVWE